jgi:hypothetical protein
MFSGPSPFAGPCANLLGGMWSPMTGSFFFVPHVWQPARIRGSSVMRCVVWGATPLFRSVLSPNAN